MGKRDRSDEENVEEDDVRQSRLRVRRVEMLRMNKEQGEGVFTPLSSDIRGMISVGQVFLLGVEGYGMRLVLKRN